MNIRMAGCRACEQITSGDCGMHGPLFIPTTLTASGNWYPIPQAAPSGAPDWLAASPPETAPALPDIELVSAAVHDAWMVQKRAKGIHSAPSQSTGEEQMRPYVELSDEVQEYDRATVRAVYEAIRAAHGSRPAGRPDQDDWTVSDRDQRLGLTHLDALRT